MSFYPKISYPIGSKQVQGGLPTALLNTLQFNSVTNQWEFVAASVASLSDLEFLRDKQLSGDLIITTANTSVTAPATVVSIIPAAGKTFFIAKYSIAVNARVGTASIETNLQNDGVNKHIVRRVVLLNTTTLVTNIVTSDSLVGDGARTYRIQKILGNTNVFVTGTIEGWIQDT